MQSMLPDLSPDDCLHYCGDADGKFDVSNFLTVSEKNFSKLQLQSGEVGVGGVELKAEIAEIISEQRLQRLERERLEDAEMRSVKLWIER